MKLRLLSMCHHYDYLLQVSILLLLGLQERPSVGDWIQTSNYSYP